MTAEAWFFKDPGWEFSVRIALGAIYHRGADAGEVLATVRRIPEGDAEAWFREWSAAADRLASEAEASERQGRSETAAARWLRSATYRFAGTDSLDATDDPGRLRPTWEKHRAAWDRFCALRGFEQVSIPYEGTTLDGYVFGSGRSEPHPWIILNNGSDGPVSAMWPAGAAAALARGYSALTYDGPGQGSALFRQDIPFRPDWEAVITPVVDFLLGRPGVDPDKIVLHGISQAGYWVPRAVAFEHRIAAAVADPGVMDVSASWFAHLPQEMVQLLDAGKKEEFDRYMKAADDPAQLATLAFRMRPYGTSSPFEAFTAVREYHLRDVADKIECPMLITDPDHEQFWPEQSKQLFDALACEKELVRFTAGEGADWHCEPMAAGLRDERVFDWIDGILAR